MLTNEEVEKLLSMTEVIQGVEAMFKQVGLDQVQMPAKTYLQYRKHNGDLRTMPSYVEALDLSAVKIVTVHPDNPSKHGLPTVMAIVVLIDPSNGIPLAIMGGTAITCMRTGAAGGIAAKYLARPDSKIVGLVGAGTQARTQLMALFHVYKELEEVRIFDLNKEAMLRLIAETQQTYRNPCRVVPSQNIYETVKDADIVVTSTPSRKPIIMNDMISSGTHITCIGADAPGKEELDPTILKRSKIIVDSWEQAAHSGEINIPLSQGVITRENIWAEIGEIVLGTKAGRQSRDEITVFTSTGLAIHDAVAARIAYEKAKQKGLGRWIKIV